MSGNMPSMNRICAYITNEHPFYMRMVSNSIKMLRKANETIPIRLVLIEDKAKHTFLRGVEQGVKFSKDDLLAHCKNMNVDVWLRPSISDYFFLNRNYLQDFKEETLFHIDGDTFIFSDVNYLIEKYKDVDIVASHSRWMESMGWDSALYLDDPQLKPFNSGVVLWNEGWGQKWAKQLPTLCADLVRKKYKAGDWIHRMDVGLHRREEVSVTCFASFNQIECGYFERNEVLLVEIPPDLERAGDSIIMHTYSDNYSRVLRKINGVGKDRPVVKARYVPPQEVSRGITF
jgi:hypothetical protein